MSQYDDLPLPPRAGMPKPERKPLGKLTQSARGSELKKARNILFIIGVLTILGSAFFVAMAESVIDGEINKLKAQDPTIVVDAQAREHAINLVRLSNGATLVTGVLYIVFGLIVQKFPVPVTIISLAMYLGVMAILALLDPSTIIQGIILKVIVIVALAKAVQAALASRREQASAKPAGVFE